jgi:tRNA uridine 5-carboxymethylaminomethyl modification enzyme
MAGINAVDYERRRARARPRPADAYIGVLIDDPVSRGPTSRTGCSPRALYRLHLRQDNADQRLTERAPTVARLGGAGRVPPRR